MKKKIVSMLLSSVMIVSSLAACGTQTGGEGADPGAGTGGSADPGIIGGAPTPGTGEVNAETGVYEVKDLYIRNCAKINLHNSRSLKIRFAA